jgi:hypothetical protein
MATVIGFSAHEDDNLVVAESVDEIRGWLLPNALPEDGLCQLTKLPGRSVTNVGPVPIYINPARIAYVHEAIGW